MDQQIKNEKSAPLKIVICGGGIAGFAAALLLREEHDVLVLESSSSNEELGAAITLSINATRLLRRSFARAGFDKDLAHYVEAEKVEGNPTSFAGYTCKYGEPWWYFSRKDIHAELKRAALSADGLGTTPRLKTGAHVERVDSKTGSVFLKSGESYKADLIIGADGIRSASGNSVFGKLETTPEGLSAYRCMIRTEELRKNPQTQVLTDSAKVLMVIGPDRRIVVYPCSSWDWMNFVCIYPDTSDRRLQWRSEVEVQDMVEKFKEFHPSIVAALSMASNAGVWQLRQRVPLPTLVKDCYALVGDAAHAMGPHQGQGACQAIEDAEALRIVLSGASSDDVASRLKIYNELRLPRITKVMENTEAMAPRATNSKEVEFKTTQTYSEYHWGYKVAEEAVDLMRAHGLALKILNDATGEVGFE
ncbi:FAD-dependent monooxygenase OpS4 [Fusarium oxysporum f. sp. raphani]|uniref:FAD-dependent monooxygenase OpS4 n=1 Tax=Fusarium oxysporum f. sp. raphani TaxID=96318 RepID=A0A8J5Q2W3_FUSOX|nr:FAD-dependent monooxygenase OpS4 [Fusarium oxysporum f. sp. raphani]